MIPRMPGDRSLEALWQYVEALEEGVRHALLNIESDNMGEGVIGEKQLTAGLLSGLNGTLSRLRAYDASIQRNMQIIRNAGAQVEALKTRMNNAESGITANAAAAAGLREDVDENAEDIGLLWLAVNGVRDDRDEMLAQIIAALEALDTAIEDILSAMRPEEEEPGGEGGGENNGETPAEENNGQGGE